MTKKQIIVRRFSVTSSKSFQTVVFRLEGLVGRPDMSWSETNKARHPR